MKIRPLAPAFGRRWVLEGFRLLRRQPVPLLATTFLYLLALMFATVLPIVGAFAPLILTPVFAVGLMHAVRAADRGQPLTPLLLFAGFRDDAGRAWRGLLVLGVLNAFSTLLALGAASLADDGTLLRVATGQARADDPSLREPALAWAAAIFAIVYLPVQMALWYAPLFTAWHRVPPLKALFFSFVAVLRNKAAFLQYGIGWLLAALAASILVQVLRLLTAGSELLLSLVLSPLSLAVLTALYCSFWPTYRDAVDETA